MDSSIINNTDIDMSEKKGKRTTPDTPTVNCRTCEEYRNYMNNIPDDNANIKHNPAPEDGLKLSDLKSKSDSELLGIINAVSCVPKKSDIRVMYCQGYSFSWTQLTVIAEYRGFIVDNPGTNSPHYSLPGIVETKPINNHQKENNHVIYIDHGKRDTIPKKISLSKSTIDKLDTLLGKELSNIEHSKVVDAILSSAIDERLKDKERGTFGVAYKPTEEERIL